MAERDPTVPPASETSTSAEGICDKSRSKIGLMAKLGENPSAWLEDPVAFFGETFETPRAILEFLIANSIEMGQHELVAENPSKLGPLGVDPTLIAETLITGNPQFGLNFVYENRDKFLLLDWGRVTDVVIRSGKGKTLFRSLPHLPEGCRKTVLLKLIDAGVHLINANSGLALAMEYEHVITCRDQEVALAFIKSGFPFFVSRYFATFSFYDYDKVARAFVLSSENVRSSVNAQPIVGGAIYVAENPSLFPGLSPETLLLIAANKDARSALLSSETALRGMFNGEFLDEVFAFIRGDSERP